MLTQHQMPHLARAGCAGTPPRCTRRTQPCCSLSPAARTRCPSPAGRSRRWCRSRRPAAASPTGRRPVRLGSRPGTLLPAPRPDGGTRRRSARRARSRGAVASTGRAGRTPGCAGCRSPGQRGLRRRHVTCVSELTITERVTHAPFHPFPSSPWMKFSSVRSLSSLLTSSWKCLNDGSAARVKCWRFSIALLNLRQRRKRQHFGPIRCASTMQGNLPSHNYFYLCFWQML